MATKKASDERPKDDTKEGPDTKPAKKPPTKKAKKAQAKGHRIVRITLTSKAHHLALGTRDVFNCSFVDKRNGKQVRCMSKDAWRCEALTPGDIGGILGVFVTAKNATNGDEQTMFVPASGIVGIDVA